MKIKELKNSLKIENYKLKIVFALFLFVFFSNSANAAIVIQAPKYIGLGSGLVGYWSFDGKDIYGTKATDRSGQGNHGTLTNGPKKVPGKIGQGISLDGTNDYVISSVTPPSTNTSISFWIKTSGVSNGVMYFANGALNNTIYDRQVYIDSTGKLKMRWWDASLANNLQGWLTQNTSINNNSWHHIVLINDIVNGKKIYLDGNLDGSDSTPYPGYNGYTTPRLHFGVSKNDQDDTNLGYLSGNIDDFRIYNRALSGDEIKRLYRIGATLHVNTQINNDSLAKGLVGYWSFDGKDIYGTKATDRSGQGNHGTLTNGPAKVAGKLGQALSFDGVDDLVNAGSASVLNMTGPHALSAWVRRDGTGTAYTSYVLIAGKFDGDDNGYGLFYKASTGDFSAAVRSGGGFFESVFSAGGTGEWYHLVERFDGTNVKLYINGVEKDSDAAGISGSNVNFNIGGGWFKAGGYQSRFNGLIDDVRVYNRALSADEIKRLYRIGATLHVNTKINNDSLAKGLVGYWSFDGKDIYGTKATDRSGQGNHGTLTNGPAKVAGKLGQALSFDGVDDYVNMGAVLTDMPSLSASVWVYPRSQNLLGGSEGSFINKDNLDVCRNTIGWYFGLDGFNGNPGEVCFSVDYGTNNLTRISSTNTMTLNEWQHLVVTWNGGTTAASSIKIYRNGQEVSYSFSRNGTGAAQSDADQSLVIGADAIGSPVALDGIIDDVRLYNRALSGDEIKRLYNLGR
ncbi:LamG domain-containing protein [Candidatus Giovannonibacteria bacterium]|nr:LamG domain-containing protein [Candidatus Giovannonibacteria bacterium]